MKVKKSKSPAKKPESKEDDTVIEFSEEDSVSEEIEVYIYISKLFFLRVFCMYVSRVSGYMYYLTYFLTFDNNL